LWERSGYDWAGEFNKEERGKYGYADRGSTITVKEKVG